MQAERILENEPLLGGEFGLGRTVFECILDIVANRSAAAAEERAQPFEQAGPSGFVSGTRVAVMSFQFVAQDVPIGIVYAEPGENRLLEVFHCLCIRVRIRDRSREDAKSHGRSDASDDRRRACAGLSLPAWTVSQAITISPRSMASSAERRSANDSTFVGLSILRQAALSSRTRASSVKSTLTSASAARAIPLVSAAAAKARRVLPSRSAIADQSPASIAMSTCADFIAIARRFPLAAGCRGRRFHRPSRSGARGHGGPRRCRETPHGRFLRDL